MRCLKEGQLLSGGLLCKLDSVVFCNHFVSFPFTENVFVLIWACFLIDTATAQTHNQSTMMRGFRWHKLRKNNEAKFKNVNINTLTCLTESFTLQPEFHLSQRWRPPYLRSQRGADHRASSFAHAPDFAPTATATPAQSHVPGLLCLSLGHGRGELSGSWENCWARACDSPASCHGVLPKLPRPLSGNVYMMCMDLADAFKNFTMIFFGFIFTGYLF